MGVDREVALFWIMVALQALGVVGLVASRLTLGETARRLWQHGFGVVLLLVGASALISLFQDSPLWMPCGASFVMLAVFGTMGSEPSPVADW